ncbi:heterokaryon incompatibility protein-domain-containing protein [Phaeosphaeriaceae sp. PMI808]|nr:heterokaryon incompatibility protein-domain-containing protein [Phaeosphaeriaceae sp. PMI808]
MRLLNTSTFEFEEFLVNPPYYAILSHTWEKDEVIFSDMQNGTARSRNGAEKLWQCCQLAASQFYRYIWVDTCCINKESSAELSEAINSMYTYYEESLVCFVYLDIEIPLGYLTAEDIRRARWTYRGWTLQEFLAPNRVLFYDKNWKFCGTRDDNCDMLAEAMNIRAGLFRTFKDPVIKDIAMRQCSIAERMSWASERQTTRPEDIAYCLFGIFKVNLTPLYGEGGISAFKRLQEEIMKNSSDMSILAWSGRPLTAGYRRMSALALSPRQFSGGSRILFSDTSKIAPFGMTNKGLRVKVPLISKGSEDSDTIATIVLANCVFRNHPPFPLGIRISKISADDDVYYRDFGLGTDETEHVYPVEDSDIPAELTKVYLPY